jgi:hypothetical protein
MLFTAPNNGNMNEDSHEYLYLQRQIELKKLRRTLALEEEIERKEAARATNGGEGPMAQGQHRGTQLIRLISLQPKSTMNTLRRRPRAMRR